MLKPILGSDNAERTLIFLLARGEGYAMEMARFFNKDVFGFQKQLDRLEEGSILVSRHVGRTRVYSWNPRYPFLHELSSLLEKALTFYPKETQLELLENRRRPRRRGKPL